MKVENEMMVTVHYKGTLTENGDEFDSSHGREPLTFTVGKGQMIPGFEEELMGAVKGDKRTFNLEPERAYGQPDPTAIQKVPRSQFPPEIEVGMVLAAEMENGVQLPFKVSEIGDDEVTVDFNHMLAGKNLTFEVEVIELKESTSGCSGDGCC
ncbi:MAG: peptidylprolyl isomerase [Methanobacteriota archaeon]|nr:MAG: peptidylprolyl isomerase [Euryarchaeota archaeon]|tara:strand:- start:10233 stop:10691 length:459 start_codon:yes stop_codon:yes gene_type:complete